MSSAANSAIIAHRNEIAYWLFREECNAFDFRHAHNEYNLQATIWADRKLKEIDRTVIVESANIPIISHLNLNPRGIKLWEQSMNILFTSAGIEAAAAFIKFYKIKYDQTKTTHLVLSNYPEPIKFIDWVFSQKFDVFYKESYGSMFTCIIENCSAEVMVYFLNLLRKANTDEAKIQSYLNDMGIFDTPLERATRMKDFDMIDVLIKNGANVNATSSMGYSFLFNTLDYHPENTDMALELLKKYHDKFTLDRKTPYLLRVMAENGRLDIFKYYIELFKLDLKHPFIQDQLHKVHPSTGNEVMEYLEKNKLL